MERAVIVNKLLFEFDLISESEIKDLTAQLPRKIVRWLGSNHPDNRMRKLFFRETGVDIGDGAVLNPYLYIEDSYSRLVKIGARCSVAPGVMIIAVAAPNNSVIQGLSYVRDHLIVSKEVVIEDDAWIGAGAIILPGVTIGQGAIVGAGAVVIHSVAPRSIVAGSPAREVRQLLETE